MSGTLAVVSQSGSTISFFDVASGERTAFMTDLISEPHELLFDSKRNIMYCSHAYHHGHFWAHGDNGHQISVIDPDKKEVIDIIETKPALGPHGLVLDAERDILWYSYEEHEAGSSGGVVGIDLKTRKVLKQVDSSTKTHWFVVTPDGKKAYTCNKTADFISILDLEGQRMIGKIETPGGTEECSISLDGKHAYFPTPGTSLSNIPENAEVLVIDTTTDEIVFRIPLEHPAQSTHVAGNGRILVGEYLAAPSSGFEGRLAVYDPKEHKLVGATKIGSVPLTLRASPDGELGFTANVFAGSVSVVNMSTMEVIKTLVVDTERSKFSNLCQGAHGMVYFP